jgi:hypothetical protein
LLNNNSTTGCPFQLVIFGEGIVQDETKKNNQLVSSAIDALGINVPVTRVRVVGNRVELWTYGTGEKQVWESESELSFEGLLVKDLRQLAKDAGISKSYKMPKKALIKRLELAAANEAVRKKIEAGIAKIER